MTGQKHRKSFATLNNKFAPACLREQKPLDRPERGGWCHLASRAGPISTACIAASTTLRCSSTPSTCCQLRLDGPCLKAPGTGIPSGASRSLDQGQELSAFGFARVMECEVSENLRDFSFGQIVARVIFALAVTALLGASALLALRWVFKV